MSLPPELIHRVLDSLRDDRQSLLATSLVSKAWTTWSQAHLFESVHLTLINLQHWLKNVPPGVGGPASHTRTLTLEGCLLLQPRITPQNLKNSLSNLASFRHVRSLAMIQWNATPFDGTSPKLYFGHFGESVRALSLQFCAVDPVALFNFLSLLPNVQDLEIANLLRNSGSPDTIPAIPEVTPSFCGTLSLADLSPDHHPLEAISALPLRFTTIVIRGCTFYEPDAYQTLLVRCRDTLVTLRFEKIYRDRPIPDISLASCDKLEEVHILVRSNKKLSRPLVNLLSSITSQKLRKISLSFIDFITVENSDSDEYDSDDEDDEPETWDSLDATLGRLAKQVSKAEGKLILQLILPSCEPFKPDYILGRFLEHGEIDIDHAQRYTRRCKEGT